MAKRLLMRSGLREASKDTFTRSRSMEGCRMSHRIAARMVESMPPLNITWTLGGLLSPAWKLTISGTLSTRSLTAW